MVFIPESTQLFQHTPQPLFEAINNSAASLDQLFSEGVNREYEGKVWSIRFGVEQNEDASIKRIFARCHCDDKVFGYKFHSEGIGRIHISYLIVENSTFHMSGSLSNGISEARAMELTKILNQGRLTETETPKVSQQHRLRSTPFFDDCPELIPPMRDPSPTQSRESPPNWKVAAALFSVALIATTAGIIILKNKSQKPPTAPLNDMGVKTFA